MTDTPPQFLFVVGNTTDSFEYKITGKTLSSVRSHARAHAHRNFRQQHKTKPNTETTEGRVLAPLRRIENPPEASPQVASGSLECSSVSLDQVEDENIPSWRESGLTKFSAASKTLKDFQDHKLRKRKQLNRPLPSPRGLLGSGRVDPFLTYPTHLDAEIHELLDVEMNYVLPGLWPDDHPQHGPNSMNTTAKAWFISGMKSPFLFNLLLWSAGSHRDFMNTSEKSRVCPHALAYKVDCIRMLNEVLSGGDKAITDEVILTVLGLAAHDGVMAHEKGPRPFNSPLTSAGALNFYGAIQYVPEHMNAITKLVALRGGINQLSMRGLPESLVIGDICGMHDYSSKPLFPPLHFHETYISSVKEWAETTANYQSLTAFQKLPAQRGLTADLLDVLNCMKATSLAIQYYLGGKPSAMTIGQIVRIRTGVQKRLLWLPTAQALKILPSDDLNMYECCRLAALIYSVAVIFPIPNTHDVLQDLVLRLQTEIERLDVLRFSAQCGKVLLWAVVLGGIAALGKPQRAWYVKYLKFLAVDRFSLRSWDGEGVEKVMKSFLWLDSACSCGGQLLWDEVNSLNDNKYF